jgi:hypothetical protein
MAGGASDRLDERPGGAQEAFFVGVEDGDQRHLGQIEAFAKKVDADEHVVLAFAKIAQQANTLERLNLGVHVAALHANLRVVAR